ncbi:UNVERIFIED_CONTAM: hypothetical protein FKN15_047447 [Acipenser sinensis]
MLKDHSSSSTSFFKPIKTQVAIPTAHVMPSTSRFKSSSPLAGSDWCSCLTPPARDRTLLPPDTHLDMKDPRPMRRWSSLTKLKGPENGSPGGEPYLKGESQNYKEGLLGDSAKLYSYKLTGVDHLQHRMKHLKTEDRQLDQNRSPGSEPRYKYEMCSKGDVNTAAAPSFKPNALDMTFSALPESKPVKTRHEAYGQRYLPLGHQAVGDSLIQPAVRTEIWLSEQMHANPVDYSRPSDGLCGLTAWQHQQQQQENLRQEAELMQTPSASSNSALTVLKHCAGSSTVLAKSLSVDGSVELSVDQSQKLHENEYQCQHKYGEEEVEQQVDAFVGGQIHSGKTGLCGLLKMCCSKVFPGRVVRLEEGEELLADHSILLPIPLHFRPGRCSYKLGMGGNGQKVLVDMYCMCMQMKYRFQSMLETEISWSPA